MNKEKMFINRELTEILLFRFAQYRNGANAMAILDI